MAVINQKAFEKLKLNFKGQRRYPAHNDAHTFDILDDTWQLGTKNYINLGWMLEVGYDVKAFVDLRMILANNASQLAYSTVKSRVDVLKKLGNNLKPTAFKLAWLSMSDSEKYKFSAIFKCAVEMGLTHFNDIANFSSKNRPEQIAGDRILDPEKGGYSEIEYQSIKENLRLASDVQTKHYEKLINFCNLIYYQLMLALIRRPTQLVELKWADVLLVGQRFSDHRQSKQESVPVTDFLFSDVDCLHIRTFKGKNGKFRYQAESTSQRLEPDLSALLLMYRKKYEYELMQSLEKQEITLTDDERHQILLRCPLFPEAKLFTFSFITKSNLFKALGVMSDSFHKISYNFNNIILDPKSDRIESDKLKLSSNRVRHTVLTSGARMGLSAPYLAKITGVTQKAVKYYIDLDVEARVDINQAFAENDVLRKFGSISVNDLNKQNGFVVRNEFDEEIGLQTNSENCVSCASKLGAPLGCYPCDNFTANQEANHQQYLDKALAKYEVNKAGSNKMAVRKLKKIILYIHATIKICNERKLAVRELHHD